VSRQHVEFRPSPASPTGWQICDLNSANGTFVNGQAVRGCQDLREGDHISLAQNGPVFIFELQAYANAQAPVASGPVDRGVGYSPTGKPAGAGNFAGPPPAGPPFGGPPPGGAPDGVTLTQLFPILSTGRDLTRKAYLLPGVLTVTFVVLMFVVIGNTLLFNLLLATYISGLAFYFVYQLCGKYKPWWLLVGSMMMTVVVLVSPLLSLFIFVFRRILPGDIPDDTSSIGFIELLVRMFFGAGLMEELLKALPIFACLLLGRMVSSPTQRSKIGVVEPLDGILIGSASAVGFTLLETLGQYVPTIVNDVTLQAGEGVGELVGLQLLIPRILGSIAGHMAYSGYFGYFIGLSILKPSRSLSILGVGYLTSAGLHGLWNATGSLNIVILAVIGVFSYAFLAASILKARALSPSRSENFATRFTGLR
jgi:RsiW-degrading membrane proteinase PrsW (M82 family)